MKRQFPIISEPPNVGCYRLWTLLAFCLCLVIPAQGQIVSQAKTQNLSLRKEVEHAISKGLSWLQKNQNTNGSWSLEDTPALTALSLIAFKGEPGGRYASNNPPFLARSYRWLEGCVQEDGSIYKKKELLTHNTALSMLAFVAAKDPRYDGIIRRSRQFLIGLQTDFDEKGKTDNVFDGGVGYGTKYEHSDLANTLSALEALAASERLARDKGWEQEDLNWAAAIQFLQHCQNLPSHNKEPWVADDAKNRGGFVYYPGHSMAGGETNASGRVSLRSYGSASYAGLLSYIYADLKKDDPRVRAVFDWLQQNYTLEENPGMGPQGLFYYYHTMAKALTLHGVDTVPTGEGKSVEWRKELALKLINLQNANGSWANENNRWWEKDPVLVTSYALIALELVHRGL